MLNTLLQETLNLRIILIFLVNSKDLELHFINEATLDG